MHYFIDHTIIPAQNSSDCFGFDSTDPENKFNITSRHQLSSSAKAFACQDGQIIVQQSDVNSALVNVILKPIENLKINFTNIQYYIYRGILKSSLINGTDIIAQASTNNEFIAQIWQNHVNYKTQFNKPNEPDPLPEVFGYDSSLSATLEIENIYDNSQSATRATFVKHGMWFGDFAATHKIGFEIITESNRLLIDLAYLRKEKHKLDISSLTGFAMRAAKEEILAFLDPAAFWGLHYNLGVNVSTYSGSTKTTDKRKGADLYTDILDKYSNKNRVYLDIRSEYGYSYNFYQNYDDGLGNNIKVGHSQTIPTAKNYATNGWPIIFIDTAINTANIKNDLLFNLRIDDNFKPILYLPNKELQATNEKLRFIDDEKLLDGTSTDWSNPISLEFPNINSGTSSKDNVAFYIKLYYYRQEYNAASPNTVLQNQFYFDSIFCPINLANLGDINFTFQQVYNPYLNYVKGEYPNSTDKFGYIAENGAVWDTDKIVFFSEVIFSNKNTHNSIPRVPAFAAKSGIIFNGTFSSMSFLNNRISVLANSIKENLSSIIDLIEVFQFNNIFNAKENIVLLGITQLECQRLHNTTGLSNLHTKHVFIDEDTNSPLNDLNGVKYRKFEVKVQGLNSSGIKTIVIPTIPIYVYSKDGFTFNSANFGSIENISNKTKISQIYGNSKVFEWTGYIDDTREENVVQLIESTCVTIPSIFPTMLYAIAAGEGLILWIDFNYNPIAPHNVMINNRINGYDYLGTDDFGGDFSRYQPYLPNNFNVGDEFNIFNTTNEWGAPVSSADFKDLSSGLLGIGATIAHRKNKFLIDASSLNYGNPNLDQIIYWTYVYFQGEGRAKNYLILNNNFDFVKRAPSNMSEVQRLALERLATWRYIKSKNIFTK